MPSVREIREKHHLQIPELAHVLALTHMDVYRMFMDLPVHPQKAEIMQVYLLNFYGEFAEIVEGEETDVPNPIRRV